ncbi:MAG: TonB-dependent receptor plug domain-containing protein [Muricauda sp.]|nr:TonB-dependent receptor plug domain-containing protein [Allomuricauda sp.]
MRGLFCILVVLLFGISILNAQEIPLVDFDQTPLKAAFKEVEQQTNYSFSFAEDVVAPKKVTLQATSLSLKALLAAFEAQTGLHFEILDDPQQIIVVPITKRNKICLFLLDMDTRLPISENQVMIDSSIVMETNEKGFVSFEDNGNEHYQLDVSGYGTFGFEPSEECSSIYLQPLYRELKEVVVTSYITTGIDRNLDGSITLSQKPLGAIPGLTTPDILQSIQMVPGVTSLDESASGIQIHGGTPDQNLVLFDHIRLFNTGYLFGMLSRFNPYATEKAVIFKTATSAAYGDRVSGVVDISTEDNLVKKISGGLGIDGLSLDGYLKTPLSQKSALLLFTRHSYGEVHESPTYTAYAKKIFRNTGTISDTNGNPVNISSDDGYTYETSNNDFRFYDINAKYIYEPSASDKISISALITRNRTQFSFANEGETKKDSLATGNGGISVNWTHRTKPNQTEEITTYFSSYDSFYRNEELLGDQLDETNIRGNRISDFGLDLKSDRYFKNGNRLTFGYQLSNTNLEVDMSTVGTDSENNLDAPVHESNLKNVLFGEFSIIKPNSGLLKMGLRMVHYGSLGQVYLEPRLNMELPLSKDWRFRAGLERRNQPISQLIEFNQSELRLENNLWRLSDNINYPLLQSNQLSTGILFNNKGWTLDLEGYYKRLTGLTSYSQGFNLPQPNLNEGKSSILGMDVLLKKRIQNYRFWIGYSFNDIKFTFPNIQEGSFPGNNDITHNFRVSNSLQLKHFQLSLGWQIRSGSPFTPIVNFDEETQNVQFGSINSARLSAFHRLDASLTYQFDVRPDKTRLQLGISALNLYNRIVPLSIIYRTSQENNSLILDQIIYRHSLGLTPNVTLRLFF